MAVLELALIILLLVILWPFSPILALVIAILLLAVWMRRN